MKFLNEALTFLFELLMVGAVVLLCTHLLSPLAVAIAAAVGGAGAVVAVWGLFLAPRAKTRFGLKSGLLVSSLMTAFGPAVVLFLYPALPAVLLALLFAGNRILAIAWKQW